MRKRRKGGMDFLFCECIGFVDGVKIHKPLIPMDGNRVVRSVLIIKGVVEDLGVNVFFVYVCGEEIVKTCFEVA